MGWNDIPKPKPTPPGTWEPYSYGTDYRGWLLRCGPAFLVNITMSGGRYDSMLNSGTLPVVDKLDTAMQTAERAIVSKVREMLPAYKVIYARVTAAEDVRKIHNDGVVGPSGGVLATPRESG